MRTFTIIVLSSAMVAVSLAGHHAAGGYGGFGGAGGRGGHGGHGGHGFGGQQSYGGHRGQQSYGGQASYGAPEPYEFGYTSQDPEGTHGHMQTSDGKTVRGHYEIRLADGNMRRVEYHADETGFHAKVITNELGTESKNPADVVFESSALTGEQAALQYGGGAGGSGGAHGHHGGGHQQGGHHGGQYGAQAGHHGRSSYGQNKW